VLLDVPDISLLTEAKVREGRDYLKWVGGCNLVRCSGGDNGLCVYASDAVHQYP
jgi:hypothetical protein